MRFTLHLYSLNAVTETRDNKQEGKSTVGTAKERKRIKLLWCRTLAQSWDHCSNQADRKLFLDDAILTTRNALICALKKIIVIMQQFPLIIMLF